MAAACIRCAQAVFLHFLIASWPPPGSPSLPRACQTSNCSCCRGRELVSEERGGREELHLVSEKMRKLACLGHCWVYPWVHKGREAASAPGTLQVHGCLAFLCHLRVGRAAPTFLGLAKESRAQHRPPGCRRQGVGWQRQWAAQSQGSFCTSLK